MKSWKPADDFANPFGGRALLDGLDDFEDGIAFNDQEADPASLESPIKKGRAPMVDGSVLGVCSK